jgi:RIO kinase 1
MESWESDGFRPFGRTRSSGRAEGESLATFFDQGLITDVLGIVKTGKEASVYRCRAASSLGVELVAAKVYRDREHRFKNDAVYQQARGRELGLRGRALRAFEQKSRFGLSVRAGTWVGHEYETLALLYNAGADVPHPHAAASDAILMEFCGDIDEAAPQLYRVRLDPAEAQPLFERIMANVELALACNRVHADLSPHNILHWRGEPRIIDLPQAVDPRFNTEARRFLARDIANVCRYFAAFGVDADPVALADGLWQRFKYGEL